jgi:hypothetical protein
MREAGDRTRWKLRELPTPHSDRRAIALRVVECGVIAWATATPAAALQRLG